MHSGSLYGTLPEKAMLLAEETIAKQWKLNPELDSKYGEKGKRKCLEDTVYHLRYLNAEQRTRNITTRSI